ncbi:hypothetical protein [Micromonospora matsumotoense]|uniref:hypothetical protein n=1 Tax=Micromonospora matsumotoense TaxID=121616 RepID=UPI0033C2BD4F
MAEKLNSETVTHATVPAAAAATIVKTAQKVVDWDFNRTWEVVVPLTAESPTLVLSRLVRCIDEVYRQRTEEAAEVYPDGYVPSSGWPR